MICPACDDIPDIPGEPFERTHHPFACSECGALIRVEFDGDYDGEVMIDASTLVKVEDDED